MILFMSEEPMEEEEVPCSPEENVEEFYPSKQVAYDAVNVSANVDSLYGIGPKTIEKLTPAGITDVKGLVCVHMDECRRFDRFDAKLSSIGVWKDISTGPPASLNAPCS